MSRVAALSALLAAASLGACHKGGLPDRDLPVSALDAGQQQALCDWQAAKTPAACRVATDTDAGLSAGCLQHLDAFGRATVGQVEDCTTSLATDCDPAAHAECRAFLDAAHAGNPLLPLDGTVDTRPWLPAEAVRPPSEAEARTLRLAREEATVPGAGCTFGPGAMPEETIGRVDDRGEAIPLGGANPVQYVFVLMQENRSFDHYFGRFPAYLQDTLGRSSATDRRLLPWSDANAAQPEGVDVPSTPWDLRSEAARAAADQVFTPYLDDPTWPAWNPARQDEAVVHPSQKKYWRKADYACISDPTHDWWGVHQQWNAGRMDGFYASNHDYWAGGNTKVGYAGSPQLNGQRVMSWYDEEQLPFYYWLADQFALGDRYFSSLLGPTAVNRDYLYAATSRGLTTNMSQQFDGGTTVSHAFASNVPASPALADPTLYDRLTRKGIGYNHYVRSRYGPLPVPRWASFFDDKLATVYAKSTYYFDAHGLGLVERGLAAFVREENAALRSQLQRGVQGKDVRPAGKLFQVNFIDADILEDVDGEDEHPPGEPMMGQRLVYRTLKILLDNPEVWKRSVLFITYDEHGGLYDHVPPPPACEPDNWLPHGQLTDRENNTVDGSKALWSGRYGGGPRAKRADGTPDRSDPDYGGAFNRYGVRVPLMVVSPWARHHYVSHRIYDHASIVRFISAKFGLPALTRRDANADPMFDLFDFTQADAKLGGGVPGWGTEQLPDSFLTRVRSDANDPRISHVADLPASKVEWYGGATTSGPYFTWLEATPACRAQFEPAWGYAVPLYPSKVWNDLGQHVYAGGDYSDGNPPPLGYTTAFPLGAGIGEANVRR